MQNTHQSIDTNEDQSFHFSSLATLSVFSLINHSVFDEGNLSVCNKTRKIVAVVAEPSSGHKSNDYDMNHGIDSGSVSNTLRRGFLNLLRLLLSCKLIFTLYVKISKGTTILPSHLFFSFFWQTIFPLGFSKLSKKFNKGYRLAALKRPTYLQVNWGN